MPVGLKYKPSFCIDIFKLASEGHARSRIAEMIGTDKRTFKKWMTRHPEVKVALDKGYGRDSSGKFAGGKLSFAEYALTALPPHLHDLWRQLNDMDKKECSTEKRFDQLMTNQGRRVKQQIFLHSLISTNFNKFRAMQRACVTRGQLERWAHMDPEFGDLIQHVHEMKKDFIEAGLMGLVAAGDTSAVIFAAKTMLKDRGYGANLTIEHKGDVTHKQVVLGKVLHKLDRRSKRKVLDQIRENKALPPRVVKAEEA